MVKIKDKKDLLYVSKKTKEKAHKVVKRPGRPFTLRDHLMMVKTEKMLLSKKHSIYTFMKSGLLLVAIGFIALLVFRNLIFELLGWALMIIGFLEILESYHRMDRWKNEMKKLKRKYK